MYKDVDKCIVQLKLLSSSSLIGLIRNMGMGWPTTLALIGLPQRSAWNTTIFCL